MSYASVYLDGTALWCSRCGGFLSADEASVAAHDLFHSKVEGR